MVHDRYRACAVEREEPDLELTDPAAVDARRAVHSLIDGADLDRQREALVMAVSEIVTNAHKYGRPPVVVRAWRRTEQVVVTVSDRGDGTKDPDIGVRPLERRAGEGGLGLWIARQMCTELAMGRSGRDFVVRLHVATPG